LPPAACGAARCHFSSSSPGGRRRLQNLALDGWSFRETAKRHYTTRSRERCSGGTIWIAKAEYRQSKYRLLKELAQARGLELKLCACNNRLKTAFPTDDSPAFSAG
jgi:hypothetical protein